MNKPHIWRVLLCLACTVQLLAFSHQTLPALAVTVTHDLANGPVVISGTDDYTIEGTYVGPTNAHDAIVDVSAGYRGVITLNSADIRNEKNSIRIQGNANVTLVLSSDNVLKRVAGGAGNNYATLAVPAAAAVAIDGAGSLAVDSLTGVGIGGGIGSDRLFGTIVINGGTIDITVAAGAAIGGDPGAGTSGTGGTITINGGIVAAKGGVSSAGIGGGENCDGGTITIAGGTITATGGNSAAGIGGGRSGNGGTISLTGGSVTAIGANNGGKAAGIGGGDQGNSGTIAIAGSVLKATGKGDWDDIGGYTDGTDTSTIVGGSVNATRGKITNPQNANGTALVKKELPGTAGETHTFGVDDAVPYNYTYTVPAAGTAYLWLPGGAALPSGNADTTLTMTATARNGGILLAVASTGTAPVGYVWQRAVDQSGPFEEIASTTEATHTDTTASEGTTYLYRAVPIVAGKFVTPASRATPVSATRPVLSGLSLSAGTLSPSFSSATTAYTASVSSGIANLTVTPVTDTPGASIAVSGDAVASGSPSHSIPLAFGGNAIPVVVRAGNAEKTYTVTVTREGTAPSFTAAPTLSPDAVVGANYNRTFTFAATGDPAPALSMDATVPADARGLAVSLTASGDLTISGTPASSGTVSATITAGNGVAPAASHTWTLTVNPAGIQPDPGNPNPPAGSGNPLEKAEEAFNRNNPDTGVSVEFPDNPIANPGEMAGQLDGRKPAVVGSSSVSGVTLSAGSVSSQTGAEGLVGFGRGWGAKIEVALKVTPKDGEILMLPVALTFALSQADLAEAGLTAAQAADIPALLAEAVFAKFPAEGADGGVSVRLPFLLANDGGSPILVADGSRNHLVIFDGERNGWLRDPVYLLRKPAAFAVESLTASVAQTKSITVTATQKDPVQEEKNSGSGGCNSGPPAACCLALFMIASVRCRHKKR